MNDDIGSIPSAKLVGEYTSLNALEKQAKRQRLKLASHLKERRDLISHELDRRCEAAGLAIQFGTHLIFKRASSVVSNYPYPEWKISMEASELHALLGWLLIKGGAGK